MLIYVSSLAHLTDMRKTFEFTSCDAVIFVGLILLWLAAYKYRGRTFRFVVNGRTGRVQGERPYSAIKITIAIFLALIIAAGVGYVIAMNQ